MFRTIFLGCVLLLSLCVANGDTGQTYPQVASAPAPVFPVLARHASIDGAVVVEAVLGASGRIKEVVNIIGHPLLRESSRLAAEKWRFLPGFAGVTVRIRFVYRIMPLGTPPEELTTIFRSPCEVEIRCNPFQPTTLPPTPKPDRFR